MCRNAYQANQASRDSAAATTHTEQGRDLGLPLIAAPSLDLPGWAALTADLG